MAMFGLTGQHGGNFGTGFTNDGGIDADFEAGLLKQPLRDAVIGVGSGDVTIFNPLKPVGSVIG